jgi:hypothetical protein
VERERSGEGGWLGGVGEEEVEEDEGVREGEAHSKMNYQRGQTTQPYNRRGLIGERAQWWG